MKKLLFSLATIVLLSLPLAATAADTVTGSQLMTEQERLEHQHKMRTLQGDELEAYRREHHEMIRQRAEEQGRRLRDYDMEPSGPQDGRGAGQGQGMKGSGSERGSQMMSEQERLEHRRRLNEMENEPQRQEYRYEHHQEMQRRAEEQGRTLPDYDDRRGPGSGTGRGMGSGRGGMNR